MEGLEGAASFHLHKMRLPPITPKGKVIQDASPKYYVAKTGEGSTKRISRGPSYVYPFHKIEVQPFKTRRWSTSSRS